MSEIELLRKMVADLQERVRALEAQIAAAPVPPLPPPWPEPFRYFPPIIVPTTPVDPFLPPWEVTCGH